MPTPTEFFPYAHGTLQAEEVSVSDLAERFGTPLYVYSKAALLAPYRELAQGLTEVRGLVCFAVKSNPNLAILSLLVKEGAGMDLVSSGELKRALLAGCSPEKIVFSGVGKAEWEIDEGLSLPLHSFNVESVAELELLSARASAMGKEVKVALRFNPDVDPKTHPHISTGLKKNKFGLDRSEILAIAKSAKRFPGIAKSAKRFPGIAIAGLSIHIGSQILSLSPFDDAFRKAKKMAADLEKVLGRPLEFMDLGGGLGVVYKNERTPPIASYTALIRKHFGAKSDVAGRYRVLVEPGRTISANAGVLVSRVLYRKPRKTKDFLVIDAAMNDLARPALYGSWHGIQPVREERSGATKRKTDVVGPVCESSDCFASDRPLPANLAGGDYVAILSAGAYGMSMASQYNTRQRPAEVLVDGSGYRLIRKRETFEDLIRNEVMN